MESQNHYHGIHPYAVNTVRHHARQLARSSCFFPADVEDFEQELMLDLHRRLPRFDSSKAGINTFISRVIENHVASMLDRPRQEWDGTMVSLNTVVQSDDGSAVELIDTIAASQSPWSTQTLSWNESIDLQTDVSRLLDRLSPSLRGIAKRLMQETVSELSVSAGIPRHALYTAIAKIRSRFNSEKFCKKSPTDSRARRYVRDMEQLMAAPA